MTSYSTNYSIPELLNEKGMLTCPVCGKEFKPNNDTKYIVRGGYTCSWQCFLTRLKERKEQEDTKE